MINESCKSVNVKNVQKFNHLFTNCLLGTSIKMFKMCEITYVSATLQCPNNNHNKHMLHVPVVLIFILHAKECQ